MNLQSLRWPVVLLTMAVALTALFGGGFVLKSRTVEEPLKMVYSGAPTVEKHELVKDGAGYEIRVTLKDVPDFAATYTILDQETRKILKDQPYTIKVTDRRNAALDALNRRVSLYVQEGIATGQFAAMADRVEQEAAKAGMNAQVAVDGERVFVQLKDKDGYLYSVVPRPGRTTAPATRSAVVGGVGL